MSALKVIFNKLYLENFKHHFHETYKKLLEKLIALSFSHKIFLKHLKKNF